MPGFSLPSPICHLARLAAISFLAAAAMPVAGLTLADDSGARLTFDQPPQRIISLAPSITELAYASGLGERMVAVTAYSDYPAAAKKLPLVGDAFRLDWERIVVLKPDLVLAWKSGLSARDRAVFEKLNLKLLVLEPRRLDDIPRALRLLGRVAGAEAVADSAARDFELRRDELRKRYAARPVVRAYFQIADVPLLTINGEHIISDVLHLCGAENVFADARPLTPVVSDEALVREQPQVLIGIADSGEQSEQISSQWLKLPLRAARQGHMVFVASDLISRPSPRIVQGAEQVCHSVDSMRGNL